MQKLIKFTGIVIATFIFISGNAFSQTEKNAGESKKGIIEAESMQLTKYAIDNDGFIKLTDSKGVARCSFALPSGKYNIDARFLSESIGQNTYTLYIADNQIIAWLGKDRDDKWHLLSEQKWHIPKNIEINKGDEIKVEALSETGSLVIFDYIEFTESGKASSTTKKNLITIYPDEYNHAIKNPLKGFRPKVIYSSMDDKLAREYSTLIKMYFKWNELEKKASDGVDIIKEFCDSKWSGIEGKNVKIIPRVELERPGRNSGWPDDMTTGDFTSDQFKNRVIALIKKLGKAWDNDSRVAYIEMGLIGHWGEMEFPDTNDEIKEAIAAQFIVSFQNKLVMIRWPNTYNDDIYNFGYYWDSFAHQDQEYYTFHLNKTSPRWKTAVIGGETAYNWGNVQIQPGKTPNESLTKPIHRDYIIDRIRLLHSNHLGWISEYDQSNDSVRVGAEIMQKALGYRFVISEVTYPKRIDADTYFTVSFKVKNTGSSPFYYNWPVEVSLLDPKTKQPVWKQTCSNLDLRTWMPGDKWDDKSDTYAIPAEMNLINQSFLLSDVPSGEYIIALAILDPAGNRPGVRFAIENYYNGGRHPIGKVGVKQNIDSFTITQFDDIQSDKSLSYDKVVK